MQNAFLLALQTKKSEEEDLNIQGHFLTLIPQISKI